MLILLQTDLVSIKETVNFVLDYFSIDWDDTVKISDENIDYSTEAFLNKLNNLLHCYAPFKKISKYKLKFKTKPWINPGLQKSISIKNKLLTKYIKIKNHDKKLELQKKYKNHRNLLSTLVKQVNIIILINILKITGII